MFVTLYNEQKVLPAHAKRVPQIQFGFYIKDGPEDLYAISQALQSKIGFIRSEERDAEHMNNRYGLIQNVPFVFVFSENSTNNVLHPHYAIFYPENQKTQLTEPFFTNHNWIITEKIITPTVKLPQYKPDDDDD